jgi:hypothetical protein
MYRFLAAFLVLVSVLFAPSTAATAKSSELSFKRPAQLKTIATPKVSKKAEATQTSAQAQSEKTVVREQSAVVVEEKADFTAPEGALYTTSDECG